MSGKEELGALRVRIDEIDKQLVPLFKERMDIAGKVAEVKAKHNLAVLDSSREQEVVANAAKAAGPELKGEASLFMRTILALSREQQNKALFTHEAPLLPPSAKPMRENITCACQGAPGAWSEHAAIQVFPEAKRINVEYFEDVFLAVKNGTANYGVVPIENSQTGAIGETYDLLRKYGCFIVGRCWVSSRQCLLAVEGAKLEDIREVFSHPQGFKQCRNFLKSRSWDLTACRNTAVAAKQIADANSPKLAAIGSRLAAEMNGLNVLVPDIMDSSDNRTSFVVIATQPEYDESSNLTSITFSTMHRSGALCETLLPFMAQGVNMTRIESRPATKNKFRFFAEIEGNILDPDIAATLRQAAASSDYFEVIGCYSLNGDTVAQL